MSKGTGGAAAAAAAAQRTRRYVGTGYKVTVSKDYLTFASAHFITFRGHKCEALHGHNYRVAATVEGAIDDECQFVVDFGVLKDVLRQLVDGIDHKVLLPTQNPKLEIREEHDRLAVGYMGALTYVFPKRDCALLPIANTTAEMLAAHFAREVQAHLHRSGYEHLTALEIEVEESFGQSATYREVLR